jgi:hypothetical protein
MKNSRKTSFRQVALILALTLALAELATANPNNGKVRIRVNQQTGNVEVEINDPDGIGVYWIFQGQGAGGALEKRANLNCPVQQVVVLGGAVVHQNHQHTVQYNDCQEGPSTERWELPEPTTEWFDGKRVEIPPPPSPPSSQQTALLDSIFMWLRAIAVLLGISVILSVAIFYRLGGSRKRDS